MTACCNKPCVNCESTHQSTDGRHLQAMLAGNPNCGKSTLFNALSGASQRVGNWSGVTVECKSGSFSYQDTQIAITDLPGVYSLSHAFDSGAIDECMACEFIMHNPTDVIINVVDASHLERHLYFTIELLELGLPVIVALNMMDAARAAGLQIDTHALSRLLGCQVVALEAHKGYGLNALKQAIIEQVGPANLSLSYPDAITEALQEWKVSCAGLCKMPAHWNDAGAFLRLLEGEPCLNESLPELASVQLTAIRHTISSKHQEEVDILLADTRFRFIREVVGEVVQQVKHVKNTWTERIDNIVLNRFLGIPIFLSIMYLLFVFAINVGGAFQDFFDLSSQAIFVDSVAHGLTLWHAPEWLIAILANGIGKGINTTLTFVPVIGAMFLFMALLEDSGYMARAAFVVDRIMRTLGLPGKAFVPMIVGFGCNVPAVMAARTLENQRDRIITVMMSPFMSCGARLAIYAVFTAAFFPVGGHNIVFALYLIGILAAIFTGFMLRKTMLRGEPAPLIMELPTYHVPQIKGLLIHAWQRLSGFVIRAGTLIVPICALFGVLSLGENEGHSLLSMVGTWLVPIFSPMGIHADNWPAAVGLLTGVLAKEVVIGTLNTLYAQLGQLNGADVGHFNLLASLQTALHTIPANVIQLGQSLVNPVLAKAPITPLNQQVYGIMAKRFDGQVGAFAYLLFVLLYFPCISTLGAMLKELPKRWAIFSAGWTTGIAYCIAVIFYQAATVSEHPLSSISWISAMLFIVMAAIAIARMGSTNKKQILQLIGEPA